MKTKINVTIKTVEHPEPKRLVDMWARLVVKELLERDQKAKEEVAT